MATYRNKTKDRQRTLALKQARALKLPPVGLTATRRGNHPQTPSTALQSTKEWHRLT